MGDKILDGHHRVEIWREITGEDPPENRIERVDLDDEKAFAVAIKLNISRRQLSTEQLKEISKVLREQGKTQEETANVLGVSQQAICHWEGDVSNTNIGNAYIPPDLRVSIPREEYDNIFQRYNDGEHQRLIAADYSVTRERISQVVTLVDALQKKPDPIDPIAFPEGKFRAIVIDPPWPMEKIRLEVRACSSDYLDYPTMTLDEIAEIPVPKLANEAGCHVYLWTTQKFLPTALDIFKGWGVNYQCLFTWLKPGGFTPFSWQYNTEHVLFGRVGNLPLTRFGLKIGFREKGREHTRKPESFYEMVKQGSPEPRLELFARQPREGFEVWGNEVNKFKGEVGS